MCVKVKKSTAHESVAFRPPESCLDIFCLSDMDLSFCSQQDTSSVCDEYKTQLLCFIDWFPRAEATEALKALRLAIVCAGELIQCIFSPIILTKKSLVNSYITLQSADTALCSWTIIRKCRGSSLHRQTQTHLQVGTSGKHTSTVHGFDCVAVQRRSRFGDDWWLDGG